ncbi:MAG: hypothetical protein EXR71_09805 [Myxococcales bacterium]|nr:hypothetical protein [Myxococcales bacterium]
MLAMFLFTLTLAGCPTETAEVPAIDVDVDGDGTTVAEGDCADDDATRSPQAREVCDGDDDDCDGLIDDGVRLTGYTDADGDGFGVEAPVSSACTIPAGFAPQAGDCDDDNGARYPSAPEVCNAVDDDCDRLVDDEDSVVDPASASTFYVDGDGDGYGAEEVRACTLPTGAAARGGDCDDTDAAFHPTAAEVCTEPTDYNCDGFVGYADNDGDGFSACGECDDDEVTIHPDGVERCDEVDNDCDGRIDDEDTSLDLSSSARWYRDGDGDGYGAEERSACIAPESYVATAGDCDDADSTVHPGATEVCNTIDDDCDTATDDADTGLDLTTASGWHEDLDLDGYGAAAVATTSCDAPAGTLADDEDCNDADADINPGVRESCNDLDDDCDGAVDGGTGIWNDTFDDNDITDWTVVAGGWSVSSGIVLGYSPSHIGPDFLHATPMTGAEDEYVMTIRAAGNHDFGLVVAYASPTEHCAFHFLQGQDVVLVDGSGGEVTVGTAAYDASVYYDVRAELSPENVDLYFDGALVYSGDSGCDNFYRTGEIGLQVHQDHVAWFDEVCVEW